MRDKILQNEQLPAADRLLPNSTQDMTIPNGFSAREKTVIYPFLALLLGMLAMSGWSAVLFATDNIEGGGPIGMAAQLLFNITWP